MLSATLTGGFNSLDQLSSVGIKHIKMDATPSARITGVQPNGDKRFIFKRTVLDHSTRADIHTSLLGW